MPPETADIFGAYSYIRAGEAGLKGWHLSASFPFRRSISLVADLSGHYGSFAGADLSQLTLMVGGRRYWHSGPLRPFAELLVGGVRHKASFATPDGTLTSTGTDLAVSPGIGADYRLTRAWSARAAVDLVLVHGGAWEADPRLSIGGVYRFGQR